MNIFHNHYNCNIYRWIDPIKELMKNKNLKGTKKKRLILL